MIKNNYPGKFIVFEGPDGSGQSTQVSLLRDFLIEKGHQVLTTKEPTLDSAAGKKIRQILDEKVKLAPAELQKLFVEDRAEHLKNQIIPALKEGKFVISDRYFFSTFAFGSSDGLDLEWLIKLNDNFLLPDVAFILKVSPRVCIERINKRGLSTTLFEKEAKLTRVLEAYKTMPGRFKEAVVIDGEREIPKVFEDVKEIINRKFLNDN